MVGTGTGLQTHASLSDSLSRLRCFMVLTLHIDACPLQKNAPIRVYWREVLYNPIQDFLISKKIRGRWQIVFSLYDLLSGRRERQCIRHIQQNSWFQKHSKTIYCGLLMYVPVEQRRCPGFEFYMCMFLVQPKLCDEGFIHSLIYSGNYWWLQGYNVERFLFVYNCSSATRTCGGYLCS